MGHTGRELTFGETLQLEHHLVDRGRASLGSEVEPFLRGFAAWFAGLSRQSRRFLGSDTFTLLCEIVRAERHTQAAYIAAGGLQALRDEMAKHPQRARFSARFALQRARSLLGKTPRWTAATLVADEENEARALYELAKGDSSFTDSELVEAAERFIQEFRLAPGMFGRLAGDLETLVRTVQSAPSSNSEKAARAALTYFALVGDTVPDDLGLVGLLDDIVVIQQAIAEIQPERAAITSVLDRVAAQWPFVLELSLGTSSGEHPISEFFILNAALLLDDLLADGSSRVALIVPEPGPLPVVCGFIRALAEAQRLSLESQTPAYKEGERLVDRGGGAEIVFEGYRQMVDGTEQPCPAERATHFAYSARTSRGLGNISRLSTMRRSNRNAKTLKRGRLRDGKKTALGPLERLFGKTVPLQLGTLRRRVLVSSRPLKTTREFLDECTLFGTRLSEVLPITFAQFCVDDIREQPLRQRAPGGAPLLTFVASADLALELVTERPQEIAAAVVNISPEKPDAENAVRIAETGTPALAIVSEADVDSVDYLAERGFRFWSWDSRWFGALHQLHPEASTHALDRYEARTRQAITSTIDVVTVQSTEIDTTFERLLAVQQLADAREDELLASFLAHSFACYRHLRGLVTPVGPAERQVVNKSLDSVASALHDGEHWWADDLVATCRDAAAQLHVTLDALALRNPKLEYIQQWLSREPDGIVVCRRSTGDSLSGWAKQVRWTSVRPRSATGAVLLPSWEGRDRMEKLLVPPCGSRVTLLLYGIERAWHDAYSRKRRQLGARIGSLLADRGAFTELGHNAASVDVTDPESPPDAERLELHAKRAALSRQWHREEGESVSARLVHFAGGHWAAYLPGHRVSTATHLVGESGNEYETESLRSTPASDLRAGDLLVLVRGSDRDAIREAVDSMAGHKLREVASCWQRAIRRYAHVNSVETLIAALTAAGCARTPTTVRQWIDDDRIRPRHGAEDIRAILAATQDVELRDAVDKCILAADELFALHSQCGRQLVRDVVRQAGAWLAAGNPPDNLVALNDRLVLVTVDFVDPDLVEIPVGSANRLHEAPWRA